MNHDVSNPGSTPRVLSLNVGGIREVEWHGRIFTTGIWKQPVTDRVALKGVNFAGDDQADRTVHGGRNKAVYAYSTEDYTYWRDVENIETMPGLFGENLTTDGIDLSAATVGEQWSIGSTILEITQPRLPCFKLGIRLSDAHFPRKFAQVLRMGAYFRVVQEGEIGAGDAIAVIHRPANGVTLRSVAEEILA